MVKGKSDRKGVTKDSRPAGPAGKARQHLRTSKKEVRSKARKPRRNAEGREWVASIHRVHKELLKQHAASKPSAPTLKMSSKAMVALNHAMSDVLERICAQATSLLRHTQRRICRGVYISTALRLMHCRSPQMGNLVLQWAEVCKNEYRNLPRRGASGSKGGAAASSARAGKKGGGGK
eukprot:TRINITY_DN52364_c0_g1_i1.p2 TRINITY_DN52364_c0_g1~~TRINITY_DN52364_c0_g1_i1.p2  ORF type:complete len:178 (+),score=26.11 TRINITY_DN52364_c0_g1_i1:80-613(+)